ncbi:auxin-responsive protein SAUR41 [Ziziphus jujuba]|uniref:Auxin-responsive protein SAUR41 n=2 Tax=Ziziphus jujuba TaxID=326968 RepID=A0A6P4AX22_ZIZJJ|nr:auxin-responsive protein SAUR41 [Ziziphus jujuba]KAH7547030.1 hypothetical protein FEM48_Zijuj01G0263700 [Ziziphus jujuba var. spinosa]
MGVRVSKLGNFVGAKGIKRLRGPPPHPPLTRKGYVPICVGVENETKRFMVHTTLLGDADFLELLYRSAEEYGFCNEGVLRIPYEATDFEEWIVKRSSPKVFEVF